MEASFPVFVGSTFIDLEQHRAKVCEAIHLHEYPVRGMEYFGARPDTPKEECLKIVRSCRAYIGVFAMRYGSVDADTGMSLTHLEYLEAQRMRLPSLIYLIDEEKHPVLPKHVDFGQKAERLKSLKEELTKRHTVSFFTSADDLGKRVAGSLPILAQQRGAEVRPSALQSLGESLPRAGWITDERFTFLKARLGESTQQIQSDRLLREILEYLFASEREAALFLVTRATTLNIAEAEQLLTRIYHETVRHVTDAMPLAENGDHAPTETGHVAE